MPTKTEAIKLFLEASTVPDLARLYNHNMECQVNVAQDGGTRIDGNFKGRRWLGWTDNIITWKSFRIPYKANTEPEYTDSPIKFPLEAHAEAIGMTGWDWKHRLSRWFAYDFDAIIGHSDKHFQKLTNEELDDVKNQAIAIPWVTVRKSTSGRGLHLYVFIEPTPTANHNEHAALARSVLGKMSALTGFDFESKVDNCGGNMWVWHRKKMTNDGLKIIKQGEVLDELPPNWKDHIKVVSGQRRKNLPQDIESKGNEDIFEELTGQRQTVKLDEEHKRLINYLTDTNSLWWWDQDHHMLITHTACLEKAHQDLNLKGFFKTNSGASNLDEQNCFCFPLRRGAWGVRRYTPGVNEHPSWSQDGAGWTRCYLNREPDLATAAKAHGGLEDTKGAFVFRETEVAAKAAELLGINLKTDPIMASRETKLQQHKDGRLIVQIEHKPQDIADKMQGWLPQKGQWIRIYNSPVATPAEPEVGNYDDMVRHLVTESNDDYGWMIKSEEHWRAEPLTHIRIALGSLGLSGKDITGVLGTSIFKCWRMVNKPFQP